VQSLAGPHAVTRAPLDDVADLRRRLPELEAAIRTVLTGDPTLGPVVADGLIAAIRNGVGITERPMQCDEAVRWMAYQPRPGQIEAISPACLRLKRSYDAFAITVEIPEPTPSAAMRACAVSAERDCAAADPVIRVDLSGSGPSARVSKVAGDRPEVELSGAGETLSVPDPGPYDLEAVFTVRAEGSPAPARTARVFHFLMPKLCGNLVDLGEPTSQPAAGKPRSTQAAGEVWTPLHQLPQQARTVVFDHQHDRALVEPKMPRRYPAVGTARFDRERRIERRLESVPVGRRELGLVDAVAEDRQHDFGRER
jgi:hypothetical protein